MVTIANAIPAESIGLVVFDLDGTLIDSRQDLATAVNAISRARDKNRLRKGGVSEAIDWLIPCQP